MLGRGVLGVLLAAATAAPAAAQQPTLQQDTVPPGTTWEQRQVTAADGTRLSVDVLRPAAGPARGTLLVATPYGAHAGSIGSGGRYDPARRGPLHPLTLIQRSRPWDRGIATVYADLRGFGGSEGCPQYGGPVDRSDVQGLLAWTAAQPWSGARIVMAGHSYSSIPVLLALADPPPSLRGAFISSSLGSMYTGPYANGVRRSLLLDTPYYTFEAAGPGSTGSGAAYHEASARSLAATCNADHHREFLEDDRAAPYWRAREWGAAAAGATVPVLFGQGLWDAVTQTDDVVGWLGGLRGWRAGWVGQHAHATPLGSGREGFQGTFDAFLDARLLDGDLPERGVEVQEGPSGRWRREPAWPPPQTTTARLALLPGSYDDVPGNRGEPATPEQAVLAVAPQGAAGREGVGTWTFSPPLTRELHLAGVPRLEVDAVAADGANLVALLYDVGPDGRGRIITRGAVRLRGGRQAFELQAQDWRLAAGHRIGILLSGADDLWYAPTERTLAPVRVAGGALHLPALPGVRDAFTSTAGTAELDRHPPFALGIDPATREGRLER